MYLSSSIAVTITCSPFINTISIFNHIHIIIIIIITIMNIVVNLIAIVIVIASKGYS